MLPPVPHTTKSAAHLLWHPKEKKLWMLDLHGGQLWRIEHDGSGAVICPLPDGRELTYQHGSGFYFDEARGTVLFFIIGYDQLTLFELKGKKFVEVKQKNALEPGNADVYVFDPKRSVLVHFAGTSATDSVRSDFRKARGGTTVRELGKDGTWRDVGTALPSATGMYCMGGWDEQLELAVLIDDAANETWGWNGKAWKQLDSYPTMAWRPFHAGTTASGALIVAHKERGNSETAQVFMLAKGKWVECEANGLCEWGGIANGFIAGPWFGPGTVQHTLGRFDEKKNGFVAAGKPVPVLDFGSVSGTPRFFGSRGHVRTNVEPVPPLKFTSSLELQGSLPPYADFLAEARGDFSVLENGELLLEGKRLAAGPKGFTTREATNFGGDGAGALLLVGGEVSYGAKRLTDVWHFAAGAKAWTKLTRTGAAPVVVGATIGFHAPSSTWVLLGGRDKHYRTPNVTWELDDKKWSSFPTKLSDEKKPPKETYARASLLASDTVTGALVFVQSQYGSNRAFAYQGKGQWLLLGAFEKDGLAAFAWDQQTRSVLGVGAEAREALALGAKLDALPKAAAAKPSASAKATKIADEVWLRQRVGDRDRFWFARIDGAGWVERFGERSAGGKTTEKRHAKRATYEAAVQAKLAAGYEPSTDKSERPAGRMSFRPVYGKRGDDLAGGLPPGISAKEWPKCRDCKLPLTHVMTLHAHDERLPLKHHAALAIFFCTNDETGGVCETWDADGTANRLLLIKKLGASLSKAPGEVMKERRISYGKEFEADPDVDGENQSDVEDVPKVNGYPGWLQGDSTPNCRKCKKPMRFVAEFSEFSDELNFAGGDAYAFVCESEHEGAVLWQH